MTEITRAYRFIVYQTDGTTPDLTFDGDAIVVPPVYGGWRVNALQGTSESEPFPVQVLDTSEQVTGNLSDANGRADLIGRVWEIQINEDGGGLTTKAKGRIVGVDLGSDVVSYVFQCGDERFFTRGIELFTDVTATTTQVWPAGLKVAWNGKPLAVPGKFEVLLVNTDEVLLGISAESGPMSDNIINWIRNDLKATAKPGTSGSSTGNFTHLQLELDGTDREVLSFNPELDEQVLGSLKETNERFGVWSSFVWVAYPASGLTAKSPVSLTILDGFFHAPNAPANETVPFHIGGDSGVDLMSWLKDQYDTHSIRYDTNAFSTWNASTKPKGLLANPLIPFGFLRVTGPERLSDIESKLFKTFGLAPFPNASGEITPRFVTLPHDVDPTALTQITSAKLRLPHPTFSHGLEMVTVIQGLMPNFRHMSRQELGENSTWAADRISADLIELDEITHDRIADLGRHVHRIELFGLANGPTFVQRTFGDNLIRQQATELFDRYGDGRVRGTYHGLSALDGDLPGDYVILNLSSYPDLATQTRAGLRLVQILERRMTPFGGEFEYIDVGADDQPVAAPAVAIIQNAGRTKHDVDITISSLPAGHNYQCQIKIGSRHWENVKEGTANETFTINNLPSNTAIQARARSTLTGVVRSPWTDPAVSVTTATLATPSSVVNWAVVGTTVEIRWTNTETIYSIMPTVGGVNFLQVPITPGSTRFVFTNMTGSLALGVKYVDDYGGEGSRSDAAATAAAATALTAPRAIVVLQGAPATGDTVHPEEYQFGVGIEVFVHRLEPRADTEIEVDDNGSFTSPQTYVIGSQGSFRIPLPLNNTTQHIRARHTRAGWTSSAWTGTVTAKPVPFAEQAGVSDGFAGGLASLSLNASNALVVNADSEDPDTDRAYYLVNKSGFVEPTTGSTEITRANMPANVTSAVVLDNLEIGYLWLKFYNDLKGFGQGVKVTLPMLGLIDYKPIVDVGYVLNFDPTDTIKMTVTVEDRHLAITTIKYAVRSDDGSLGAFTDVGWDTSTGTIGVATSLVRAESVAVGPGKNSEIHYQIIWVDEEGNSQTIAGSSSQAHMEAQTKNIRIAHTYFQMADEGQTINRNRDRFDPNVVGTTELYHAAFTVPKGVTITGIAAQMYRQAAGDIAITRFYRGSPTADSSALLATLTGTVTAAYGVKSASISELVADDLYTFEVDLKSSSAAQDARFKYAELTYTVPSTTQNTY